MNKNVIEELKELYYHDSKHSHYQSLPEKVKKVIDFQTPLKIEHYDKERFDFLKTQLDFRNKTLLDLGGNTGYFSFESLSSGVIRAKIIEGKAGHVTFVNKLAKILSVNLEATVGYVDFKNSLNNEYYDIIFNLNIIHHLGGDFGDKNVSKEEAKRKMMKTFDFFIDKCQFLVFQMGFNWKGNRYDCLFEHGTKAEMIDFVKKSTEQHWDIVSIGVAEGSRENAIYKPVNKKNIERQDSLGEFLNRPIFIVKTKK